MKVYKLKDQPFRYGGIMRDYTITGERAKRFENKHAYCFKCRRIMDNTNKLYCATFENVASKSDYRFTFKLLCRHCAYSYEKGVIEKNAEIYYNEKDYKGEI